jgi:hypothetical protein
MPHRSVAKGGSELDMCHQTAMLKPPAANPNYIDPVRVISRKKSNREIILSELVDIINSTPFLCVQTGSLLALLSWSC